VIRRQHCRQRSWPLIRPRLPLFAVRLNGLRRGLMLAIGGRCLHSAQSRLRFLRGSVCEITSRVSELVPPLRSYLFLISYGL